MALRKAPPSAWSKVHPVPVFSYGLYGDCATERAVQSSVVREVRRVFTAYAMERWEVVPRRLQAMTRMLHAE